MGAAKSMCIRKKRSLYLLTVLFTQLINRPKLLYQREFLLEIIGYNNVISKIIINGFLKLSDIDKKQTPKLKKTFCAIKGEDIKILKKEIKKEIGNPKFYCKKCLRVSSTENLLCKAKKL